MADPLRISSPLSSSPAHTSSLRPDWPWSRTYTHRTSLSSLYSASSTQGLGLHNSWDPRSSFSSTPGLGTPSGSQSGSALRHNPVMSSAISQEDSTRQWTFMGFEWVIRDVHKLRDFVEGRNPDGVQEQGQTPLEQGDFEILKQSPTMGDNKFKLEIAPRTPLGDGVPNVPASANSTLSLYITSLTMEFAHSDYEMSASMMTAIKCQDDRVGERGARPEWVWEFWQNDWVFRHESEVWECPLPSLSALLENGRIRDTDSFVVCVQIHCPVGPFIPQQPSVYYVPRDLLDGLEASLDNPNTGDVRFICLEKLKGDVSPPHSAVEVTSPSHRPPSSTSSHSPFSVKTTARKRVIYAHSDILTRRSDYFATMLASSFSENSGLAVGERKLYTIVVEEADFETIYWLLKFCYANWLLFKEDDDPRSAVDGVGAGWSAKWLSVQGDEWDWKTFRKSSLGDDGNTSNDTRSVTSLSNGEAGRSTNSKTKAFEPGLGPNATSVPVTQVPRMNPPPPKASTSSAASVSRQMNTSTTRRPVTAASPSTLSSLNASNVSSVSRPKPVPGAAVPTSYPPDPHYPISPRTGRQHPSKLVSTLDPHPHPTPTPGPASALSMYQVAHRYAMPGLAALALEHMMCTITPQSSFALLLATCIWDELHSLIEDYVVEKWDEVSVSDEFEQCCQEVAAGEWGADGGKTMTALFRRLRSPNALSYSRA